MLDFLRKLDVHRFFLDFLLYFISDFSWSQSLVLTMVRRKTTCGFGEEDEFSMGETGGTLGRWVGVQTYIWGQIST
jgi:hypothetical protein